jgi:hypothetical protein
MMGAMGSRGITLLALASILVAFTLLLGPLRDGFTDDGFIHLQYARNIMARGEYAFNPGEPSFGTTSPLWVFLLAGIGRAFGGENGLLSASRAASWACGLLAILAMYALSRRLGCGRATALMAALLLACDAWFLRWTGLAMESSAAVLLLLLLVNASIDAPESARFAALLGVLFALAALLRPEAALLPGAYAAALALRGERAAWRRGAVTLAVFVLLLAPWLLFAKLGLGSLLPGTFGVKRGDLALETPSIWGAILPMAKIVASTQGLEAILILGALLVMGRSSRILSRPGRFPLLWSALLPAAYALLRVRVLSRYLLLVTPFLILFGMIALEELLERASPRAAVRRVFLAAIAALLVAINLGLYFRVAVPPSRAFSQDLTAGLRRIAETVRDQSPPDAVVAGEDIGYLGFYSRRRVLDLGGIIEPETAALRRNHTYDQVVEGGLYLTLARYPHVDYLVDRDVRPHRFDGAELEGHRLHALMTVTVRTLGIRRPGPYYFTLYRLERIQDGPIRTASAPAPKPTA